MEGPTMKYSSIGWAVNHMLAGHKMRRKAWHTSLDWVAFVPKGSVQVPEKFGGGNDTGPFLMAKLHYADKLVAWTATQADLLAEDWEIFDAVKPGEYHLKDQPASA